MDGDGFVDIAFVAVKEGGVRAARVYRNVPVEAKASHPDILFGFV